METGDIDRFIARYTEERQHKTEQIALQHSLAYAYMICNAGEIDSFFRRARALLVFNISSLSLFDNPLRNSQVFWLLFIPFGLVYSVNLAAHRDLALVGLIYCAGTLIFGTALLINVISNWIDTSIKVTYYREIINYIDSQQFPPGTEVLA